MHLRINPYNLFFISILYSSFIGYVFNSGLIAYSPILVFGFLVLYNEFNNSNKINFYSFLAFYSWFFYVFASSVSYFSNPYGGSYASTHLLSIWMLPVLSLAFIRSFENKYFSNTVSYLYNALVIFIVLQLIVCVGQISTYILGVGLPVSELYSEYRMVTGTFTNSNDLAAVVLAILFFIVGLEKFYFKQDKFHVWLVALILLFISGSRSAIVVVCFLFFIYKITNLRKLLFNLLNIFILSLFVMFLLEYFSDDSVIAKSYDRLNSIFYVFEYGISSDNSMSIRLESYLHFISNLPSIGFGSGVLGNYHSYSYGANFNNSVLLFENPHSLFVEIGYWLGWPGLIFFFTPFILLYKNSKRRVALLIVFITISIIPSSVLGNMTLLFLLMLMFYDFRGNSENYLPPSTST